MCLIFIIVILKLLFKLIQTVNQKNTFIYNTVIIQNIIEQAQGK